MSILIKGLNLPKTNEVLAIRIYPSGKVFGSGCKLIAESVEVKTPHGRLIDADKLVVLQLHDENDNPVSPEFVPVEFIDEAETIIEAEE